MKTRLFVMLVGLGFSWAAQAGSYSTVIQVEAAGLECNARAARVSVLFQSIPGVERIESADCLNEFTAETPRGLYRVFTIAVQYRSRDSLKFTSAIYGTDVFGAASSAYYGAFSSLEDCLVVRAEESAAFEEQTGNPALFTACLPDESDLSGAYFLSIKGFGEASKQLVAQDFRDFFRKGEGLSPSQIRWLAVELTARGADVRWNDGLKVLYYAERAIPMNLQSVAWFAAADQCSQQESELTSIFSKQDSRALVECLEVGSRTRLQVLSMAARISSPIPLSEKYSSFESCMKFKPAAAAREERNDPQSFLGLLCAPDSFGEGFVHLKFLNW